MRSPLRYFLVVSVCLHLAVLAQWKELRQIDLGDAGTSLQLTLIRQPGTEKSIIKPSPATPWESGTEPAAEARVHPLEKTPTTARGNGDQPQISANLNVIAEGTVTPLESELYSPFSGPDTAQYHSGQISDALRRQLAAYFKYPRLAQRRGWQGRVMLSVHLEPNGKMSRITVVHSSGHPLLDRSALRSAKRAAYVPDVIEWLAGQHFDTVVPVHYQLIDS